MKNLLCLICYLFSSVIYAQKGKYDEFRPAQTLAPPIALQTGITVELYKTLSHYAVRLVYRADNQSFYYNNEDGNVFQIPTIAGVPQAEVQVIDVSEHGINRLQGMTIIGNTLILCGNNNDVVNKTGFGVVKKCTFLSGGSKSWTTMLTTENYASSGTLFDHAFSAVCINPTQDSLYIASGSRTDHGEIKSLSGLYPNLREQPLTTKIYRIPLNATGIYLPNDETLLTNSGYIYARGVRNEFDLAFNGSKRLFGVENSGERDDPEEMNWIRQGHHYGFPWNIGGNLTPQQYPTYDPSTDLLIPPTSTVGSFSNDPTYPPQPSGVTFTAPITNLGPDANWLRNPTTGAMFQSTSVTTFTGHRSPVGLVFDTDSTMQMPYTGNGFVLAFGSGGTSGYLDPADEGGDLCHLKLNYGRLTGYSVNVTRLVKGFYWATDSEKVGNVIYVAEYFGKIWKITLPLLEEPTANYSSTQTADCLKRFSFTNLSQNPPMTYKWEFGDGIISNIDNPTHDYASAGTYTVKLTVRNPAGTQTFQNTITVPSILNLSSPINSSTNKAGVNTINADNTITGASNDTNLRANKAILFNSGFKAENIKSFKADIGGCFN